MSLSGVQIKTCSTSERGAKARGGGRKGVVGLELDHRPHHQAKSMRRALGQRELGHQLRRHAIAGLVSGEQLVAKRLDDVIEGACHMGYAVFAQQRQQRAEDPARRPDLGTVGPSAPGAPK